MAKLRFNLDEIQTFGIANGKYRIKLIKVEQTLSSKKKPMLTWYWKTLTGNDHGKELRSFTSLSDNALGLLKAHLEAFGYSGKINTDTAKLVGKIVTAVIGNRTTVDDSGNERIYPQILNFINQEPVKEEKDDDDDDEDEEDEDDDETEAEDDYDDDDYDDDDDEDEEEEDEPAPKPKKKSSISNSVVKKAPLKKNSKR